MLDLKLLPSWFDSDKGFTISSEKEEAQELNNGDGNDSHEASTSIINLTDDKDVPPPCKKMSRKV